MSQLDPRFISYGNQDPKHGGEQEEHVKRKMMVAEPEPKDVGEVIVTCKSIDLIQLLFVTFSCKGIGDKI